MPETFPYARLPNCIKFIRFITEIGVIKSFDASFLFTRFLDGVMVLKALVPVNTKARDASLSVNYTDNNQQIQTCSASLCKGTAV